MKNIIQNKIFVILLALVGIIALGALASGIREMEFREPDPFYFEWPTSSGTSLQTVIQQMEAIPIEQVIMFWALVIIFTVLIIFLINPKYRWKIILAVIRMAIIFIVLTWALKAIARNIAMSLFAATTITQNANLNLDTSRLPVYTPPADVPWVSYFISLTIALGIVFLGWWFWNLGTRPHSGVIRQNIADIARQTLGEIAEGRDFGDAVTTCYVRMNDAVNLQRGMQRQEGMTPSEFAARLEAAGLPGDPVRRLTHLFEVVRYGARTPGAAETQEAVTCLNAIIVACGAAS
jgi:hypothetical protein